MKDKFFFIGQKAFIERDNKVLVLFGRDSVVDLPGGKIQDGEIDFDESLKREVREETGLEIEIVRPIVRWSFKLRYGHNIGKEVFLVGFKCKYLSGEVKISKEHSGYKWVDKEDYKELSDESEHFKAVESYFDLV